MDLDRYEKQPIKDVKQELNYAEQLELMTVNMDNQSLVMFMTGFVIAKLQFFEESQENYLLREKLSTLLSFIDNGTLTRDRFISKVLEELDKSKKNKQFQHVQPLHQSEKIQLIQSIRIPQISQEEAIKRVENHWIQFNKISSGPQYQVITPKIIEPSIPNSQRTSFQSQINQVFFKCLVCKIALEKVAGDPWVICKCRNKIYINCGMTQKPIKIQCLCPREKSQVKPVSSPRPIRLIKRNHM